MVETAALGALDLTEWLTHPMVVAAAKRSGWEVNGDPASLFSALSEVLNEIEEKVPGISFTALLDGVNPSRTPAERAQIAARLMDGGMSFDHATDAVRPDEEVRERFGNLPSRSDRRSLVVQLLREGVEPAEVAERLDMTVDYVTTVRRFEGLSKPSRTAQAVEMMRDGASNKEVREALGFPANTVCTIRTRMADRPARSGRDRDPERSRAIAATYSELRSIKKTARHWGVATNTVRAAVAHAKRLECVA